MFTNFSIPVRKDEHGGITTKDVVVQDELLPLMADIIDKASRPVLLTRTFEASRDVVESTSEAYSEGIRQTLTWELHKYAREQGLAVITKPEHTHEAHGTRVVFRCSATGMHLVEQGL